MAEIVNITKNQPFVFYVPLVILNADGTRQRVEAVSLTNIVVTYCRACESPQHITPTAYMHYLVLEFDDDLQTGKYDVIVTANLPTGRQFTLRMHPAFGIVDWDSQSNWRDYIVGDHIELTDQPFIAGYAVSDAEYDALKDAMRQAIAEAESAKESADAAREAYTEAIEHLDGIAQETTAGAAKTAAENAETAANAAKVAAEGIIIPTVAQIQNGLALDSTVAKEATLTNSTEGLGAIKQAVDAIPTTAPATPTDVSDAQAAIIAAIQANAGVPTLTIPSTTASQELAPNTLYVFAERTNNLTLTLGTPITGKASEYHLLILTGESAPSVTWPDGISWNGGDEPTISEEKTYEVSIMENIALFIEL